MSSNPDPLRVIFFGTAGSFSVPPLAALLDAGLDVRAVVMPALATAADTGSGIAAISLRPPPAATRGRQLPMLTPQAGRTIASLAAAHDIPLFEAARLADSLALTTLAELRPDAICIACFPRRLPPALLALPRLGCLNAHPSLLPDKRGPDPLFWTFHQGDAETGVTIHVMDAGLDTGPILAQMSVPVPEGIAEADLEAELATMGGWLLLQALTDLASGAAHPIPQDDSRATYHPLPGPEDYTITVDWPARRAYTFARGVLGRGEPVRIAAPGASFRVLSPLGYDETATLAVPWRLEGDILMLRCASGVLRVRAMPSGDVASSGDGIA
jgi:methionyl-tRNA formyltransferase